MMDKIIWVQDLFGEESGLNSVLSIHGEKLIGKCDDSMSFSISHSYSNKAKLQGIVDSINKIKTKLGDAEISSNLIKTIAQGVGGDNLISKALTSMADWGEDKLKDLLGDSANYRSIKNLESTVRYWNNTSASFSIPNFTTYFYPKILKSSFQSPTIEANKWLEKMTGKFEKIDKSTEQQLGKWVAMLGKATNVTNNIPWYSYTSPNNYGPKSVDYTKLDNVMSGTFWLKIKDTYDIKNLLVKDVQIKLSPTLIKGSKENYPAWISFVVSFERSVELTVQSIRQIFRLRQK